MTEYCYKQKLDDRHSLVAWVTPSLSVAVGIRDETMSDGTKTAYTFVLDLPLSEWARLVDNARQYAATLRSIMPVPPDGKAVEE